VNHFSLAEKTVPHTRPACPDFHFRASVTKCISDSNAIQTHSLRQFPVRRKGDSERMTTNSSSPSDTLFYDFSGMGNLALCDAIG
jgi:hypothetical protein